MQDRDPLPPMVKYNARSLICPRRPQRRHERARAGAPPSASASASESASPSTTAGAFTSAAYSAARAASAAFASIGAGSIISVFVSVFAVAATFIAAFPLSANARGVSPYLPLHESPEIERMVERVLILGGRSVLKRPIAAATVLDALPQACERDAALCERVRHYLAGLQKSYGLSYLSVSAAAATSDDDSGANDAASTAGAGANAAASNDDPSKDGVPLPNRHGMRADSPFELAGRIYWQPSDYLLFNAGVVAYEHDATPTGSVVSFGVEQVQVDVGWRDHWLSPMTDSAMLLSTQAQTMPSITVSNYSPLTRLGVRYELFVAEMSESSNIVSQGALTEGKPRLAGLHFSIEPFPGWSLGVNRILQYGGGARPDAFGDLFNAFFNPSGNDNAAVGESEFGNQAASVTSSFVVPAPVPFSVYFEYAGEDTSTNSNFRLGNSALSAGIRFPSLAGRFDLTVELSEWQNSWYVHHLYRDGLTNEGNVIGHWGADWRVAGDGVGAATAMARLGWELRGGALVEATYRTLENEDYTSPDYEPAHALDVRYSRRWGTDFYIGARLEAGRDSLGDEYGRLSAFIRY